jgi:hypothetical protein
LPLGHHRLCFRAVIIGAAAALFWPPQEPESKRKQYQQTDRGDIRIFILTSP